MPGSAGVQCAVGNMCSLEFRSFVPAAVIDLAASSQGGNGGLRRNRSAGRGDREALARRPDGTGIGQLCHCGTPRFFLRLEVLRKRITLYFLEMNGKCVSGVLGAMGITEVKRKER
jgi:hypothetical protein